MSSAIKQSKIRSASPIFKATGLHLLGLDYQRLTMDQNGLQEKLTSVYEAKIVNGILA